MLWCCFLKIYLCRVECLPLLSHVFPPFFSSRYDDSKLPAIARGLLLTEEHQDCDLGIVLEDLSGLFAILLPAFVIFSTFGDSELVPCLSCVYHSIIPSLPAFTHQF